MLNLKVKKCLIYSFSILISLLFLNNIYAAEVETYEDELREIQKEHIQNTRKLTGVQKQIAQYSYDIVTLDIKMNEYNKKLVELQEKIEDSNKKIKEYEKSIENTSSLYDATQEKYAQNLRFIYENGLPNIFELLVKSEGISDLIRKLNVYTSILDYYKDTSSNIKNRKEYIDYIKKQVESQKNEIETFKVEVEKAQAELNKSIDEKKAKVEELQNTESELKEAVNILNAKKAEAFDKLENEIDEIVKEAIRKSSLYGSTTFTGGNFAWPVEGYTTITTRFAEIYNLVRPEGSAHTGCDIAGSQILGKPVVAIESGTVVVATYSNYGYGNYVIIDHGKCTEDGKTYLSLYGHNTSLVVNVGDVVEKGQVISYVGSTGNSTGPHLHFEIRIDGKLTDPLVQYPAMEFFFPYG